MNGVRTSASEHLPISEKYQPQHLFPPWKNIRVYYYYYYEIRTHSTHTDRKTDDQTDRERIQNNAPSIKSNLDYRNIK